MKILLLKTLVFLLNCVLFSSSKNCGKISSSADRIVGGREVGYVKYPWFCSLMLAANPKQLACGCSLISKNFVITAAHCFKPFFAVAAANLLNFEDVYIVRFGVHNICINEPSQEIFEMEKVYIHEEYFKDLKYYDIAVIKLVDPVNDFTPICLPDQAYTSETRPKKGLIVGLGKENANNFRLPCTVKEADVNIYPDETCRSIIQLMKDDPNTFKGALCAGVLTGGTDTCQGDSGGPLQVSIGKNRYMLLGITSYGYGCATKGLLGFYTDVSQYLPWINDKINIEENNKTSGNDITRSGDDNIPHKKINKNKRRAKQGSWLKKLINM